MALTYYIRSWDPRSTYPKNPQEGDICYTITLDQTWAPVGGVKKDNIVKEEIYQNGAWVEQGGGGAPEIVLYDGSFHTVIEQGVPLPITSLPMSEIVPSTKIPDSLKVVYNGTTYDIPKVMGIQPLYGEIGEGGPSFDNYPVALRLTTDLDQYDTVEIITSSETEGTIKVSMADVVKEIAWKQLSVGQGGMIVGGTIVYHTDGAVDEDGNALWVSAGMLGGTVVDIAEGGIVTVKAESAQNNANWNGNCVVSGCNATLLAQSTNSQTIYRVYEITNISSGASLYCNVLFT